MANDREKLAAATGGKPGGGVQVDDRGRNVWQWSEQDVDSTTVMLNLLNNDELELEPTRSVPIPGGERSDRGRQRAGNGDPGIDATLNIEAGRGFDPYNRS